MRKIGILMGAAAALGFATSASATVTFQDFDGEFGSFAGKNDGGLFTDLVTFNVPSSGQDSASLTAATVTPKAGITFSSVMLNGMALAYGIFNGNQVFSIKDLPTTAGSQTLSITGTGRGTYGGSLSFAAAVPEPASWAMMIGGFGLVGGSMRRTTRNGRKASLATA